MMLKIRQIYAQDYPTGKKVLYTYTSDKYYDVRIERVKMGWHFSLKEENLAVPFMKKQGEEIFGAYKEDAEVYLAEFKDEEVAVIVIEKMEWNNTLLIHDLYVDFRFKNMGIGRKLMDVAKRRAMELGARAITLETQTSNYPAIQFYLNNGFELVGLNTMAYTNEDVRNKEVRIEMSYILEDRTTYEEHL